MKKFLLITMVCVLGMFGNLRAQEADTLSIGSGEEKVNYAPTYIDANYSVTQQIFFADEIQNKVGKITGVAFKCVKRNATRTLKIYMVGTDKTAFTGASDWATVTEQNMVFEGDVEFTEDEWTYVEFQKPFLNKQDHNILLCVNDVTASWSSLVTQFASDATIENRMIYTSSYNDVLDATNMTSGGKLSTNMNHIKLVLIEGNFEEEPDGGEDGIEEFESSFEIYPNPVENGLLISSEEMIEEVMIYNAAGAEVYSTQCEKNEMMLNIADFNSGVYFVKIKINDNEMIQRIIKK